MMPSPIAPKDPVAGAAILALLAARWEVAELLSRRPSLLAADLLRGHAAELAASSLASNQVLGLALETAANDIEAGSPPLEEGALFLFADNAGQTEARRSIRNLVMQQPGEPPSASDDLVAEIERRHADERLTPTELAAHLAAEARLQEALWDDPRLPAQTSVRLAMLCSIPKLIARATELDPNQTLACRDIAPPTMRSRWRSEVEARPASHPASRRGWRWSAQNTGRLLLIGLFVVVLAAFVAPLSSN